MRLRPLRRLLTSFVAGPAQLPGPVPRADATGSALLEARGAVHQSATVRLLEGRDTRRALIEAEAPSGSGLLAVAVTARATGGPARLSLQAMSGDEVDWVHLTPRTEPWRVWLFGCPNNALFLELAAGSLFARVHLDAVDAWAVPGEALDPAALIPHCALAADPAWSRAYGDAPAEDVLSRLREQVFRQLQAPSLVPFLDGLRLWLEPGDELSRAVFATGTYEPETLLAVETLLPVGGVFVDVGAHCGLVSVVASRRAAQVMSFEPSAREFSRLQANLAANGAGHATAVRVAVSDVEGSVTLRLAEASHAGHNTIGTGFAYGHVTADSLETVAATTVDVALKHLDRCDLIKLDIEGAELKALRGGIGVLSRLRPALILEVFDRALAGCGDSVDHLFAFLDGQGYELRELDVTSAKFDAPASRSTAGSRNIVALPRR